MNLGQLSPKNGTHANDNFMTVESSVGVFNHTSVFGGIVATSGNKYKAINLGIGQNIGFLGLRWISPNLRRHLIGVRKAKATVLTMPKIYRVLMGS
ncbi:fimbria/pilus outer membrane usher protein [Providencia rettgeri]|uniref:Fimbria/pilus outer membrane usher protein n=1 Tax=Providencia rettgeri TaxID=587 RepID=A0A939NA28_PRORE|nr:fimbria/pilus outer membrane usher protein [Providencia rettgeri]